MATLRDSRTTVKRELKQVALIINEAADLGRMTHQETISWTKEWRTRPANLVF